MLHKNIKSLIKHSRLFFILFIVIMIVTSVGLLFTCNFMQKTINDMNIILESRRTYSIIMEDDSHDAKLNDFLKSEFASFTQSIYLTLPTNSTKTTSIDLDEGISDEDWELINSRSLDIPIKAYYFGKSPLGSFVIHGEPLTQEDFVLGNKKIIIPVSYASIYESWNSQDEQGDKYDIGDYFIIGVDKYLVVGISTSSSCEIPYRSIVDFNHVDFINIVLHKRLNEADEIEFTTFLKDHFKTDDIFVPEISSFNLWRLTRDYILIMLIMVIGFLNFSYIYTSILEKRKKLMAIARICGNSILRGITSNILEVALLTTICFIISSGIYKLAIQYLINMTGSTFADNLYFSHYLILLGLFILVVVTILLPVVIKYNKKSPISALHG